MKSTDGKYTYVDRKKLTVALAKRGEDFNSASEKIGRSRSYITTTFAKSKFHADCRDDVWAQENKGIGFFNKITVDTLRALVGVKPEEYEYDGPVGYPEEKPVETQPTEPEKVEEIKAVLPEDFWDRLYSVINKAVFDAMERPTER